MQEIRVIGGRPLEGAIQIQGSKNAALPILAASLLHRGQTVLYGCPRISDVEAMLQIMESLGCRISWEKEALCIDAKDVTDSHVGNSAGKMRSSVLFMGSLLGRMGEAAIAYPGGCVIGERPVDMHLQGFADMGICVQSGREGIRGCGKPKGGHIRLQFPSVGATENLLIAACGATAATVLEGCAREPEVTALCGFLQGFGASIFGAGTERILVCPPLAFQDTEYVIPCDRIVAGTYALAAVSAGGTVEIKGVGNAGWRGQMYPLQLLGAELAWNENKTVMEIRAPRRPKSIAFLDTAPYPGFPTDLQSQMLAVLARADGISCIQESIFEKRFQIVEQLRKMGARVQCHENLAIAEGVPQLKGCAVEAGELRGGAALVLAALGAEGESRIRGLEFIERGYENICRDLTLLGARIRLQKGL